MHFEFIETPSKDSLEEAIDGLKDQGALRGAMVRGQGANDELTALGKILVNLPVDVAIGKMLIMGCLFQQVCRLHSLMLKVLEDLTLSCCIGGSGAYSSSRPEHPIAIHESVIQGPGLSKHETTLDIRPWRHFHAAQNVQGVASSMCFACILSLS